MTFVEGYIQENAHNAPQFAFSMPNTNTCASCSGSNQMVISTDPSVIMQLSHNATYTIYIKARVSGMRMFPLGPLTPYDVTKTVTVTGDGLVITQAPDYIILWDPANMSGVNLSCTTTDAQIGLQQYKYTISGPGGSVEKTFTNQSRPGQHSFTWDGKDSFGVTMPRGLYSTKMNVMANIPTMSGDCNRSSYLTISDLSTIFAGYNGEYNFWLQYKLTDSLNTASATSGQVFIYDKSTLDIVYTYTLSANDLTSSSSGVPHEKIMALPIQLDDGKKYTVILQCWDNNASMYRDHAIKPAMEAYTELSVPTAHNYGGCGPNESAFDTLASLSSAYQHNIVDGSAYFPYVNTMNSATQAVAFSPTATIFNFIGHGDGDGGFADFKDGLLSANWIDDNNDAAVYQHPGCFANAKFVMYQCCESGRVGSYGDLLLATTVSGGAQLALGFTDDISYCRSCPLCEHDPAKIFTETFWSDVTGNRTGSPATVAAAANTAKWAVYYDNLFYFYGYDSYRLEPSTSGGMYLAPASTR